MTEELKKGERDVNGLSAIFDAFIEDITTDTIRIRSNVH
jgi:hypothetical protein